MSSASDTSFCGDVRFNSFVPSSRFCAICLRFCESEETSRNFEKSTIRPSNRAWIAAGSSLVWPAKFAKFSVLRGLIICCRLGTMTPEERFTKIENAIESLVGSQAEHAAQIERENAGVRDLIVLSRTVLDSIQQMH